jgi:hypothetical protein
MKPVYRFDIEQNSDEWYEIKLGMFSASTCPELLMDKKTKGYTGLINRIVEERITGERCENNTFKGNWATERGHEFEPLARNDYELRNLQVVKQIGVVVLNKWALCSPDGLINDNGLHQIKCPIFSTQKEYLEKNKIPTNYYKQMQFELFITGRDYNVFTSFHPKLRALDIIVNRDEVIIAEIKQRLNEAIKEVKEEIKRIKQL